MSTDLPVPTDNPTPSVGTLEGRVLGPVGEPLAGIVVSIVESSGPHPDIAAVSAADGTFRLSRLPAGPAVVEARQGGVAIRTDVDVPPDAATSVEIRLC